jgi:hypothetical protein
MMLLAPIGEANASISLGVGATGLVRKIIKGHTKSGASHDSLHGKDVGDCRRTVVTEGDGALAMSAKCDQTKARARIRLCFFIA